METRTVMGCQTVTTRMHLAPATKVVKWAILAPIAVMGHRVGVGVELRVQTQRAAAGANAFVLTPPNTVETVQQVATLSKNASKACAVSPIRCRWAEQYSMDGE